jgi:hypothetical protein
VAAAPVASGSAVGQLRDWEIFNRPDQGTRRATRSVDSCRNGGRKPFVSVLEARLQPPYQGSFGIGRTAQRPAAPAGRDVHRRVSSHRVAFPRSADASRRTLDAFSPFIPHEEDDSGPASGGMRHHTVQNKQAARTKVSIAYSVENLMLERGEE